MYVMVLPAAPAEAADSTEVKITYTISVFSASQMKKDAGKRGAPKNTFLQLSNEEPWDTFQAQMLVKVDSILKPVSIAFEDYAFYFSVPRIHAKATDLTDEESYRFMIERALKGKDPSVSITIEQRRESDKKVCLCANHSCTYVTDITVFM